MDARAHDITESRRHGAHIHIHALSQLFQAVHFLRMLFKQADDRHRPLLAAGLTLHPDKREFIEQEIDQQRQVALLAGAVRPVDINDFIDELCTFIFLTAVDHGRQNHRLRVHGRGDFLRQQILGLVIAGQRIQMNENGAHIDRAGARAIVMAPCAQHHQVAGLQGEALILLGDRLFPAVDIQQVMLGHHTVRVLFRYRIDIRPAQRHTALTGKRQNSITHGFPHRIFLFFSGFSIFLPVLPIIL